MSADVIIQQLVNGVTLGGMYALIALGYTLVYGILLMINFAHSEMFMGGAYVGLGVLLLLSNENLPASAFFTGSNFGVAVLYLIAFAVAFVAIGILGVVIERVAYRPLRHAPRLAPLISAIGVSIFLQNAVLLWVDSKAIPYPEHLPGRDDRLVRRREHQHAPGAHRRHIAHPPVRARHVHRSHPRGQGDARHLAGP